MKLLIFKLLLTCVPFFTVSAMAQEDTIFNETIIKKEHEKRSKFIPDHVKLQYAGSMGLVSVGVGWSYGKKEQWETDFIVGYVPKYTTSRAKACTTLKQNYIPWKTKTRNKNFYIEPLTCGVYVNTIWDDDFWGREPKKYPSTYYSFSTKVRLNIYAGQRVTYKINPSRRLPAKSISAFYEISSSELYIISAAGNGRHLNLTDYLHLSFGVKMQLF